MQRGTQRCTCRLVRLQHCTALYKPGNELTAVVFCVRRGSDEWEGNRHFGWKRTHCCQPVASKVENHCSLYRTGSLGPKETQMSRSWGPSLLSLLITSSLSTDTTFVANSHNRSKYVRPIHPDFLLDSKLLFWKSLSACKCSWPIFQYNKKENNVVFTLQKEMS